MTEPEVDAGGNHIRGAGASSSISMVVPSSCVCGLIAGMVRHSKNCVRVQWESQESVFRELGI